MEALIRGTSARFAILLGVIIMAEWPASGLWVIGLIVAIEMIMNGLTFIIIALTAKNVKAK